MVKLFSNKSADYWTFSLMKAWVRFPLETNIQYNNKYWQNAKFWIILKKLLNPPLQAASSTISLKTFMSCMSIKNHFISVIAIFFINFMSWHSDHQCLLLPVINVSPLLDSMRGDNIRRKRWCWIAQKKKKSTYKL